MTAKRVLLLEQLLGGCSHAFAGLRVLELCRQPENRRAQLSVLFGNCASSEHDFV
jgi:hypothetical protein